MSETMGAGGPESVGADQAKPTTEQNEAVDEINKLDLSRALKLARATYHWGAIADEDVAREYREFLRVCWTWSKGDGGPRLAGISRRVDDLWHCHMLLPAQYVDACEAIFGAEMILDHDPWFNDREMPEALEQYLKAYKQAGISETAIPKDFVHTCQWAVLRRVEKRGVQKPGAPEPQGPEAQEA